MDGPLLKGNVVFEIFRPCSDNPLIQRDYKVGREGIRKLGKAIVYINRFTSTPFYLN